MKILKGDEVLVLRGKDKGKKGKIDKVLSKKNKILITGINLFKKNVKRSGNKPAGITDIMKPMQVSKVVLVCSKCNLPTKASYKLSNDKKVRICKKCKQEI